METPQLYELVKATKYGLPGENPQATVTRAILDVYHHQQVWIEQNLLPRDRDVELEVQKKFKLPDRLELVDRIPVRVINMSPKLETLIQIHALGAVAATLVAEFLQRYNILGFADGFAASTVMRFLRRGSMNKTVLVPLTHTPRFVHYEMSGATLVGAMARMHYGYQVRSTLELADLPAAVRTVQVAVLSCGSVLKLEPKSRLARFLRESKSRKAYEQVVQELKDRGVVGDLLYHYLKGDGTVDEKHPLSRPLESARPAALYPRDPAHSTPMVYAVSPDGLARIAERGVSLLLVHAEERAEIACAAMKRDKKPVNFIVTSSAAAKRMLAL
jgi:DNA-binding transcriptional regulator LsrR (DeoR family)